MIRINPWIYKSYRRDLALLFYLNPPFDKSAKTQQLQLSSGKQHHVQFVNITCSTMKNSFDFERNKKVRLWIELLRRKIIKMYAPKKKDNYRIETLLRASLHSALRSHKNELEKLRAILRERQNSK